MRAEGLLRDLRRFAINPTTPQQYPSAWSLWLAGVQHLTYQVNGEHRLYSIDNQPAIKILMPLTLAGLQPITRSVVDSHTAEPINAALSATVTAVISDVVKMESDDELEPVAS